MVDYADGLPVCINDKGTFSLRALAVLWFGGILILFVGIVVKSVPTMLPNYTLIAEQGKAALPDGAVPATFLSYLSGEWEYFPGVYMAPTAYDASQLKPKRSIRVPIGSICDGDPTATYRLLLTMPRRDSGWMLYLPNLTGRVVVFLNGMYQPPLAELPQAESRMFSGLMVALDQNNFRDGPQELVISSHLSERGCLFYKRVPILGSRERVESYVYYSLGNTLFVFGLLILIAGSGYIFMYLVPGHVVISLITIFDSVIILRLTFGFAEVNMFLASISPFLRMSDEFRLSMQVLMLMVGGMTGVILANFLFDPEQKMPHWLTLTLFGLYGVMAMVFPVDLVLFEMAGIPIILIVYLCTFGLVCIQFVIAWRRERTPYTAFHIIKTGYIGAVIWFDILMIRENVTFLYIAYAYIPFFLSHQFIRLYDHNSSYRKVNELNRNLEQTVRDRTEELVVANAELRRMSEEYRTLSMQDTLTGLPNRRAFIENGRRTVARISRSGAMAFVLAIDIDKFKSINDSWGHAAGDEVLKTFADLMRKSFRLGDYLGRIGGEEFSVILPEINREDALQKAEYFRLLCSEHTFLVGTEIRLKVTASLGLAELSIAHCSENADEGEVFTQIMHRADIALYQAKEGGRNRICIYELS